MSKDLLKEDVNFGELIYSTTIKEFEKHERGKRWYLIMTILAILLISIAILTANYLFALIIVLFAIIMVLQEMNKPIDLNFAVTETGIIVGNKYYSFSEMEKYWIIYNPPEIKALYFEPKSIIKHRIMIPLGDDVDPVILRSFLNMYILEDLEKEEEPLSDRLGRILKIQ